MRTGLSVLFDDHLFVCKPKFPKSGSSIQYHHYGTKKNAKEGLLRISVWIDFPKNLSRWIIPELAVKTAISKIDNQAGSHPYKESYPGRPRQ